MVVAVGLEPTHLAVLAPKASASAISPCDEVWVGKDSNLRTQSREVIYSHRQLPLCDLPSKTMLKNQFHNLLPIKRSNIGVTGFEPATAASQTRYSTKLSYTPNTAARVGIEPTTNALTVHRSTAELPSNYL